MRWASFSVPTHYRPELLELALRAMCAQRPVDGWDYEVLVVAQQDDPAWDVIREFPRVRGVSVTTPIVGAKANAALWAARGEILMCSGDDDLQSPGRLSAAVAAHESGHRVHSCSSVMFYDWSTRRVAQWTCPAGLCGATTNWNVQWMRSYGGWYELPHGNDSAMLWRLGEDGITVHRLPDELGLDTVCTYHTANIGAGRPFPDVGEETRVRVTTIRGVDYGVLPAHARSLIESYGDGVPGGAPPVLEL